MTSSRFICPAIVLAACIATSAFAADPPQLGKASVKEVIAAMTKEEKANIVIGTGMSRPPAPPAAPGAATPGAPGGPGGPGAPGAPGGNAPAGPAMPPDRQSPVIGETLKGVPGAAGTTFPISRLGIPAVILADGPAGLRIQPKRQGDDACTYYCTAFPIETLLASSWDVELLERVGQAMGNEVYEYGVDVLLAPALNIHRNPLGGRNFEYYSEDPLVSGRMAAAMTKGVQSQGVGVSVKHYAANDHEWNRNVINVKASQRALREIYLRGFEIVVSEAQPWTVMSSYNKLNGTYTSEMPSLITGVLRDDWGYKGLVMTDWFGGRNAVAQMIAGNDLLEPGTAGQQKAILAALESGELKMEVLDRNVERVLNLVLQSPTFKKAAHTDKPDLAAHAKVGRDAASQGMVLLKNDASTLPFTSAVKTIALFGNTSYDMVTGGTGSGDVNEAYTVQLTEGLKAANLTPETRLAENYAAYLADFRKNNPPPPRMFAVAPRAPEMTVAADELARLAKSSDVAMITIGRIAGEGRDRQVANDYEFSDAEKALIKDVAAAFHAEKKKVLVVLNTGGVLETASWRDSADAILLVWHPGQEAGHAVADVITGKVNPSGKLTTTFPLNYNDVPSAANFPGKVLEAADANAPAGTFGRADRAAEVEYLDDVWVGYRHFASKNVKVAYPFGFGLSYTTFGYSDLKLSGTEFGTGLTATVTIKNTGKVAGREVVQLYLSAPGKSMPKPAIELKGFAKTKSLAPGESQTLTFKLTPRDLTSFDEVTSSWVAEAGTYTVRIGASSQDLREAASFTRAKDEKVATVSVAVR